MRRQLMVPITGFSEVSPSEPAERALSVLTSQNCL
jgi:hypothetical protein